MALSQHATPACFFLGRTPTQAKSLMAFAKPMLSYKLSTASYNFYFYYEPEV